MDFSFTAEEEAFRSRLRKWLEETSSELFGRRGDGMGASTASLLDVGDDAKWQGLREYHKQLYEAGYVALHWPKEWGGGGASLIEQAIYQDEVLRLDLLRLRRQPARDRSPRPRPSSCSAPGSQRALPRQDADRRGDLVTRVIPSPTQAPTSRACRPAPCWRATPSWSTARRFETSLAQRAHMQVLLVRTDPAAPKHKGISYLLVDMKSPGITVRPLMQITGESGFNEVFYDNVRVPKENLVGEINQGWQVSIATLMWERVSGGTRHPVERTINELIELAKAIEFEGMPAYRHPYIRQKLSQFGIESRCLRLSRYRGLTAQLKGKVPGPESSFGKLFATELNLRVAMFADELLGPYGTLMKESIGAVEGGRWTMRTLAARGLTIAAGSSEIQHNIIGERVLKLPKG